MASKQEIGETKIDDLINEIGQEFEQLKNLPETAEVVVPDSIPILWFGDLEAYEKSDLRVLTVSKNPSDAEFGENQRFKNLSALTERAGSLSVNIEGYKSALNQYFRYNPSRWFNQLAKFLPIFNASYTGGKNVAVHVDLFTPIATHPVWPGLSKMQQEQFDSKLAKLVNVLQPDVLITSLSASNLRILLKSLGNEYTLIFDKNEPGKSAKYVRAYRVNHRLIVINGRNFQGTYFGGMSAEFVNDCLQKIREVL
ncbi:MAG: hypothetical protein FWH31_08710 [Streptococcaceae bacterium]|nr:hypothetical protein [Streptococcaceae bacterium]